MSTKSRPLCVYQLIEIPATDLHISPVLVQTLGERLRIVFTALSAPIVGLIAGIVGLGSDGIVLLLGFGRSAARSTKETANCMTYGRSDRHTPLKIMLC